MSTQTYALIFIGIIGLLVLGGGYILFRSIREDRKYTQTTLPSLESGEPLAAPAKAEEELSAFALNGLEAKSFDEVIKDVPDLVNEPNADAFLEPELVVPTVSDAPLPSLPEPPARPEVPIIEETVPHSHVDPEQDFLDEALAADTSSLTPSPVAIKSRSIGFDDVPRFNEVPTEDQPYVGRRVKSD